jgi:type IV pilus assembly protein PilM
MSSIIGKVSARTRISTAKQSGGRPPAAVEISTEGVLAAARPATGKRGGRAEQGDAYVYAFVPLPASALVSRLEEPGAELHSLRAPEAVTAAIRSALDEVSPRTRAVTLVLPDTLVRVFVLDFDSLPAKPAEAIPVVRFRLRKTVPFDVEHAGVSYQVLTESKTECKVLAAVVPGPILAEYEAAVRAAGYEPGAVLPSSLAALEAAETMEAVLAANLSAMAMTTAIANGQDLLLYRTIELPEDPGQRAAEVQRSIAVAAAYYEDKLGARPRQLHYAGIKKAAEFARMIGDPELSVVEWTPHPESGATTSLPQTSFAGVAGALAGAG